MRIGFVVPGGVDRSGTRRVIPHLVERLAWLARRHDVRVVAMRQERAPGTWTLHGAEVHNVGPRPRRPRALRLLRHLHDERPFDVLHGMFSVPQGVLATVAGRLLGVPSLTEAPGGDFADLADIDFGAWHRAPGRAWVRVAASGAAMVVPTESARTLARRRGFDVRMIPLELDPEAWPTVPPRPRGGPPVVAWIGSLNRVKDPFCLLDVAERLRVRHERLRVEVVGADVLDGAVAREVARRGLDGAVRLRGFLPQAELLGVLDEAHLLLVTSRFEGAGRMVLEAAARGVPTVGFPVGHLADWKDDGAVAVAREAGPDGLAAAAHALLVDEGARRAVAEAAQRRLEAHAIAQVGEAWEDLYGELTGKRTDA